MGFPECPFNCNNGLVFYRAKSKSSLSDFADKVKKADLARSLFRLGCQNLAQMSIIHALAFGVRRIYFTGSFISLPLASEIVTAEIEGRILLRPEVCGYSMQIIWCFTQDQPLSQKKNAFQ